MPTSISEDMVIISHICIFSLNYLGRIRYYFLHGGLIDLYILDKKISVLHLNFFNFFSSFYDAYILLPCMVVKFLIILHFTLDFTFFLE